MIDRRQDFDLLQRFTRDGEQSAFADLIRRHLDLVFATALRKVEDSSAAQEIAQNVFVVLARKVWQFAPDDSLPAWLHKAALLESKSWLRGELGRRRRELTAAELHTTMHNPEEQPAFQELLPLLDEALLSLREKDRTADLPADMREHLLEELGFNWDSSEDFIVVSKETVRDIRMYTIGRYHPWKGKLTDSAAAVLALSPQERSQIEAAMERVKTDYEDWPISHTERSEPKDDVLAQYTVHGFPATNITTITNNFFTELSSTIGKQRTELILPYAVVWIKELGISDKSTTMILKRASDGAKQVLKAQVFTSFGTKLQSGDAEPWDISKRAFPKAFLPVFPNGWADVAEREGFEIPTEPQKQ